MKRWLNEAARHVDLVLCAAYVIVILSCSFTLVALGVSLLRGSL